MSSKTVYPPQSNPAAGIRASGATVAALITTGTQNVSSISTITALITTGTQNVSSISTIPSVSVA